MGFLQPPPPPFDLEEWREQPFLDPAQGARQDWAVNGFGAPDGVYLLYVVKLVIYVVGGFLLISATTPGLGGLGDFGDWWRSRSSSRSSPSGRCSGRSWGSARAPCRSTRALRARHRRRALLAAGRGPFACHRGRTRCR